MFLRGTLNAERLTQNAERKRQNSETAGPRYFSKIREGAEKSEECLYASKR
jgi:hypothetical protein